MFWLKLVKTIWHGEQNLTHNSNGNSKIQNKRLSNNREQQPSTPVQGEGW